MYLGIYRLKIYSARENTPASASKISISIVGDKHADWMTANVKHNAGE